MQNSCQVWDLSYDLSVLLQIVCNTHEKWFGLTKTSFGLIEVLLILILARDMVGVIKWSDGDGCSVLQYFVKERNQCLVLSPYKVVRADSFFFFFSRGLDWRTAAGGDCCVLCCSKDSWSTGQWAEVSPHFPFAAGKQVPCVARGDAGAGRCLCVAKAPWAGSLRLSSWKLLDVVFWSCPDIGLVWMVSFSVCTWRRVSEMGAITAALPRPELLWEPD